MSTKRWIGLLLVSVMVGSALVPGLAGAGGGFAPPPPGFVLNTTKDVSAVVVVDPHLGTAAGSYGAITLNRKHHPSASAAFQLALFGSVGALSLGCDLSASQSRFVAQGPDPVPMNAWMSQALLEVLFQQVGITIGTELAPILVPAVTQIVSQQCAPAPAPDNTANNPGFLIMEVNIGFLAAPGTPIPK